MIKYKKFFKQAASFTLVLAMLTACSSSSQTETTSKATDSANDTNSQSQGSSVADSSNAPDGKYSELITYTLGKNTPTAPRLPEGDTYENNAYTRYLREKFNIQNENAFEAPNGDAYNQQISMAIVSGDIPDIMVVHDYNAFKQLYENDLIADLTDAYEQYASPTVKDIYDSFDGRCLDGAKFDDKLMALPGTKNDIKPNLLWLRKDWMDKLGLEAPKSLDDVENILTEFVQKDPQGNGSGKTVGLTCNTWLGDIDFLFTSYGGYKDQWIEDESGNVINGSITEGMKQGLAKANDWYKKGLIDKEFATRTYDDNIALVVNGQCGAFYGYWYSPDYPFRDALKIDPTMDWQPYLIPLNESEKFNLATENPCDKYVVVSKEFEHPEVAVKIINGLSDYMNTDELASEIKEYQKSGVDPGVSPFDMVVQYKDALYRNHTDIKAALDGQKDPSTLSAENFSNYENIVKYLEKVENNEKPEVNEWASYASRMIGAKMASEAMRSPEVVNVVNPVFFGTTKTMKLKDGTLKKMQEEKFLKIIMGEESIDSFDTFVDEWKKAGGEEITAEVAAEAKK